MKKSYPKSEKKIEGLFKKYLYKPSKKKVSVKRVEEFAKKLPK